MSDAPYAVAPVVEQMLKGEHLSSDAAREAMLAIVEGRMPPVSLASFLTALRSKGEHVEELAAFASVMREKAVRIQAPEGVLDTCGTGGDKSETFNISTVTALVAAAMGIPIAKHGNRSVSSKSGSADVLRVLGVNVEAGTAQVERCIREAGIGFLFAPALHPGMKHAVPVRKELGIRTVFNLLGPLSNPAQAKRQLLGVFDPQWCEPFANVLNRMGSEAALVVCGAGPGGEGNLDEVSTWGPTTVARLANGSVSVETFEPSKVGISQPSADALAAKDPDDSAGIIRAVLKGETGPARDVVLVNGAAAAQAAGKASSWDEGMTLAAEALDSGKAADVLQKLAALSNEA